MLYNDYNYKYSRKVENMNQDSGTGWYFDIETNNLGNPCKEISMLPASFRTTDRQRRRKLEASETTSPLLAEMINNSDLKK